LEAILKKTDVDVKYSPSIFEIRILIFSQYHSILFASSLVPLPLRSPIFYLTTIFPKKIACGTSTLGHLGELGKATLPRSLSFEMRALHSNAR
jgi:hypothetical protein